MCGICGVWNTAGAEPITPQRLRRMADTMAHRGPDDAGIYISEDRRLGLGFRRLSIVDLVTGQQPMSNEDGTVSIVFNGEIYNHADLRVDLEARGHRYRTRSDTETIVHAYEEWDEACVRRLRGMFAFAVYDERRRPGRSGPVLFLARDRLGIKPLYYACAHGRVLFGSEVKAILAWPDQTPALDEEAFYHYLTLAAAPAPLTLFRGIHKLPPGHTLTAGADGQLTLHQYWRPLFPDDDLTGWTEPEIVARLRDLLRESIRLRMMSDVPFGVLLSGGLDSSLNLALMSELMTRPVDTFSVAIEGDRQSDERTYARRVARHFGADHHEVAITARDFVEFLPRMVYHQDEPLADPVCVPLYYVSRLAREHGTIVVQVGEGADELFAGYTGYAIMADFYRRWFRPFSVLPAWVKRPASVLASHLLPARRAEYARRAAANEELFWGGATAFSEHAKRALLDGYARDARFDTYRQVVAAHYADLDGAHPGRPFLDRIIYLELKHRLPELLLMRVDKMSMAASVEARVPYLDHELVRFALAIPASLKYRGGRTKHVLREVARGLVPDEILDRPKTGFCGGSVNMVRGPVLAYAEGVITGSRWLEGLTDRQAVRTLLAEHRRGAVDHSMAIWSLTTLALWHRHWIEGAQLAA
jgi:asparagine synthase (glutamine-hydrolysing)